MRTTSMGKTRSNLRREGPAWAECWMAEADPALISEETWTTTGREAVAD